MAFFSSTTSISLGIAFTSHNVLAVRLDQEKGILLKKAAIAPESLVNGLIVDEQGVVTALAKVVQANEEDLTPQNDMQPTPSVLQDKWWKRIFKRKQSKSQSGDMGAAICIPPQAVYTALFAIPTVIGKNMEDEVLDKIQKTIPLEPDDMVYGWQQVGKSEDSQHVAVAAMSKNNLRLYQNLCKKQKLRLEAVTTPASVIWLSAAEQQKQTAVLISRLPEMSAISAFMYNHWPIDEIAASADYSLEDQVKDTKQMMEEQTNINGIAPRRIVFIGSDEDFAYLQEQAQFDIPVERTTFAVPERLKGYELGLFSILSARKDKLINLLEAQELVEEE